MEHIEKLELTEEEEEMQEKVRLMWEDILKLSTIEDHTDFFKSGAGSMDVTRYRLCGAAPSCIFTRLSLSPLSRLQHPPLTPPLHTHAAPPHFTPTLVYVCVVLNVYVKKTTLCLLLCLPLALVDLWKK